MLKDEMSKFVEVMDLLSICFPERAVNENMISVYFHALSDYEIEKIEIAARQHILNGYRFPYVADLVSLIR